MESKFEKKIEQTVEENTPENFGSIWGDFKLFLKKTLDIRNDTDKSGTIQDVKDNISMQGHTAWILVFSILIASIGLNANSAAVVIGAMLISPLMGPILGVGLSIGINDIDTLRRSLVNLGVMIGLSLITSFLFFKIPIFQELTPELEARTAPDVRDVFIAIAGGLALIIALSRRSKQTNTIAGVAIATALMPPLCTAGYGLAIWDLEYFFGAMFLFTINTIFIALAAFIIVKFLRFPMVKYINSAKRRRIAQLATFVAILVFGFSVYTFYGLYKKNSFEDIAKTFIEEMKANDISIIDEEDENINYQNNSIKLVLYGRNLTKDEIKQWETKLVEYGLPTTKLNIQQGADDSDLRAEVQNLSELYSRNQQIISSRDEKIKQSEDKIKVLEAELSKYYKVPFSQLSKEVKIYHQGLKSLKFSNVISTNFESTDTIAVFTTVWYDSIPNKDIQEANLKKFLKTSLDLDTLRVVRE
ncbi:MAG: TIGR00341 family protein [Lutibacter sp.]|nr:MAG: TIGR00341 family protein [Lutibacter sp.]